jgi:hypothetical protein
MRSAGRLPYLPHLVAGGRLPCMRQRYSIRQDREGWTVFDVFTGEPVVIAMVPQTGLDIQDADELAELLDHPVMAKDPQLRQ